VNGFPLPSPAILERRLQGFLSFMWLCEDLVSFSVREAVLVPGVLRGMNTEAQCIVRAVKVSLPKLDVWEYVKADITQSPADLPLGAYEVSFEDRKMRVIKTVQGWTSAG